MTIKKELENWIKENQQKNPKNKPRDAYLSSFLSAKNDIEEGITEGFSKKIIWNFLKDKKRIEFSYATFARYVHKFIDPKLLTKKKQSKKDNPATGFTFNNKFSKENLI